MGRTLAATGVGYRSDVGQVRRIHQHHVRAIGRQRLAADRPGQDPRQFQCANAGQGPLVFPQRFQCDRVRIANPLDGEQRLGGDRRGLFRRIPLLEAAQRRGHQAGFGNCRLEVQGLPAEQCPLGILARRLLRIQSEQAQGAVAVVREIRVQADEPIGAAVQTRELVPLRRYLPVHAEPFFAFQRRVRHVDAHTLARRAAHETDFTGGQRRRGDGGLGRGAHRERGRQHRVGAGEFRVAERFPGQTGLLP